MAAMKLRTVLGTLTLALTAALSGVLPAASEESTGPVYNVEIIVFRGAAAEGAAENWSEEAGARSIAGDESASGSLQVGRFVALLPAAAYQLNELESRLRASGTYVPVAHAAW